LQPRLPVRRWVPASIERTSHRQRGGLEDVAINVTEIPRLANGAEKLVWQTLVDQLEPGDLVVPGQRVTDHLKDHEVDFMVAIEGAGIVCIEVKGGEVWHDGNGWCQTRGDRI